MSSSAAGRQHPFHIIQPSPWPALASLAVLAIAWGGVDVMHGESHHSKPWFIGGASCSDFVVA